jgi:hypothetical protein
MIYIIILLWVSFLAIDERERTLQKKEVQQRIVPVAQTAVSF